MATLPEENVMRIPDYVFLTGLQRKWRSRGICPILDEESDDIYARTRGWYITKKTGKKMFNSLADSILALEQAESPVKLNIREIDP